jgi:anti-sigma regulatory factor (Ser/Thr protein kinase)
MSSDANRERKTIGIEPQYASEEFLLTSRQFAKQGVSFSLLARLERDGFLTADEKKRVTVAFHEALVNAHEHGNLELRSEWRDEPGVDGRDLFSDIKRGRLEDSRFADRVLEIKLDFDGTFIVLQVRDEGPGYDPVELRESSAGVDPASHGRGLKLIRHFMDDVDIREGGRLLELKKRLVQSS